MHEKRIEIRRLHEEDKVNTDSFEREPARGRTRLDGNRNGSARAGIRIEMQPKQLERRRSEMRKACSGQLIGAEWFEMAPKWKPGQLESKPDLSQEGLKPHLQEMMKETSASRFAKKRVESRSAMNGTVCTCF